MSKYTIKLEQLVSSQNFGDLVITIQYDFTGAKIISVQGEKITPEMNSQLGPILNMFNFCLTKGISAAEVVEQMMVTQPNTPLDGLLAILFKSINEAPIRIQDVAQGDVIEINPEILKHLR
jgi:hypothetical protein